MFPVKTLIVSALLSTLVLVAESSFEGGSTRYSIDLSRDELTRLYNEPVYQASKMVRRMAGLFLQFINHAGVRVTLGDGSTWLVHKGSSYGQSSQTVVVSARYMSRDWTIVESKDFGGTKKVADFVEDGESDYHIIFNNCHHGANRMMNQ